MSKQCKKDISRDAVFNRYVNRINEQIMFFKQSKHILTVEEEQINNIEPRSRLYSLEETAGLLFLKTRNRSMVGSEEKEDDLASLISFDPQDIVEKTFSF